MASGSPFYTRTSRTTARRVSGTSYGPGTPTRRGSQVSTAAKGFGSNVPMIQSATPAAQTSAQAPPFDATYTNTVGANNKTLADLLAQLGYQRGQLNTEYGFAPTYDAQGNITSESIDTSNPFSKAALLAQTYQRDKAGYGQGLAARGQLYSSAYQSAQDYAGTQNAQSYDALRRAYEGAQQGLTFQGANAANTAATNNANAYGDYVTRSAAQAPNTGGAELGFGAPAGTVAPGLRTPVQNFKPPKPRTATARRPGGTRISSGYRA